MWQENKNRAVFKSKLFSTQKVIIFIWALFGKITCSNKIKTFRAIS